MAYKSLYEAVNQKKKKLKPIWEAQIRRAKYFGKFFKGIEWTFMFGRKKK